MAALPPSGRATAKAPLPPLQLDIEPDPSRSAATSRTAASQSTLAAKPPATPVRPKASLARPSAAADQLLHWSDDDGEIDVAFSKIESGQGPTPGAGQLVDDAATKATNLDLFAELAIGYASPLRAFVSELSVAPTTKQWLDIVQPALSNLCKGAEEFADKPLVSALGELNRRMNAAASATGGRIGESHRKAILDQYGQLVTALPKVFDLGDERARREPIVVHQLLLQVPGVHKVTLDRLYGAGFNSLEAYYRSTSGELVAMTGVRHAVAQSICSRFERYWRERTERPVHGPNGEVTAQLEQLVGKLAQAHEDFRQAEVDEDADRKRNARNDRRSHALQANVLLAQLGATDLVKELERSPTEQKIERLKQYVETARQAAHA